MTTLDRAADPAPPPFLGPGSAHADDAEPMGELRLDIGRREARSYARSQFHRGALRVLRPHYLDASGQVTYSVINPGGAYLGSDRYELDIAVEQGASLLLTTQSATKVYRTPQGPARQNLRLRLAAGATCEYLPEQLIVYREGSYRQDTAVEMHPTASLVLAEVITPGWSPDGAAFHYDEVRLRTSVTERSETESRLWAVDQTRIVPAESDVTGLGFMEGRSHLGQLLVADVRVDDDLVDEVAELADASGLLTGVSRTGRPVPRGSTQPHLEGFTLRSLADRTEHLTRLHREVANLLRGRWRGQGPIDLRTN